MNGFDRIVRWSEELGFRATHRDRCHIKYGHYSETVIYLQLTLRVQQNLFVLFFELIVAECFHASRNLFPDFGYEKLKCVFDIKLTLYVALGIMCVNISVPHFLPQVLESNWKRVR